jgi:tetratricopeptide (TPR) repeat protein
LTAEEREHTDDPRPSIVERYPSRALYLARVADHLVELRRARFLLDEDVAILLDQAARQASLLHDLRSPADVALEAGAEAAVDYLRRLHEADATSFADLPAGGDLGGSVNRTGYQLMGVDELATACELFRLNTVMYPDSWNAWDSLAECRYRAHDLPRAAECYTKSLELNPDNSNAAAMLERLRRE